MNKPSISADSDYCIINTAVGRFYYGYEITVSKKNEHGEWQEEEWCFQFKSTDGNTIITIPYSKLKSIHNPFDCLGNCILGLGWVLAKYGLREINE